MPLSRPTKFIQEQHKKHGKLVLTDEEIHKFSEVIYAISYREISAKFEVSEDSVKRRMSVCKTCPYFKVNHSGNKYCDSCGCNLGDKTKVATEFCPQKKWDMDIAAIRAKLKEAVNSMNETRDEDWYGMMSLEDFEEWQANEAGK